MRRFLASLVALCAFGVGPAHPAGGPADGTPRTVYYSTGDNQDYLGGSPLDSRATIGATFEVLRRAYRVNRVWWRGGQDEVWAKQFVFRPENREFARVWRWWKHLAYEGVGTNRIAVKAAHDRGMEIWLTTGLFDLGSHALHPGRRCAAPAPCYPFVRGSAVSGSLTGRLVFNDPTHLHGPLGLVLAPNGDLIAANGDAVNPDPKHPNELVEFTPSGKFVASFPLDPGAPGGAFGVAITTAGGEVRFAAVDDDTNTVHVWTFQQRRSHSDRDEAGSGSSVSTDGLDELFRQLAIALGSQRQTNGDGP